MPARDTMNKKQYYTYNPNTNSYDPVVKKQRDWNLILWIVNSIVFVVVILFLLVYMLFGTSGDEKLKMENEALKTRLNILSVRVDDAMTVLEDLKYRDNNLYRVILQADPIDDKVRNAGTDNASRYAELAMLPNGELLASVTRDVDRLERNLYVQDNSYNELVDMALLQDDKLKHIPAIIPISGSDLINIRSHFGWRIDPVYGYRNHHDGIDFGAKRGVPVYATGDAEVVFTGWKQGYGNTIDLDHGYGYVTRYAHLNKIEVKKGQQVVRGERIGQVGNTGKSTGPHLHYEVMYRKQKMNPINYIFMNLSPEEYDHMIQDVANINQ